MTPLLAQIFMGWPAILLSLLASVTGIARRRPAFLVLGAALSLGPAWYLLLFWPTMGFLGYSLPFLHLSGALALYYRQRWLAGLLLLPHLGIAGFLASIVLSQ